MAAAPAGRPYPIIVPGEGASTLTFTLPTGVDLDVEAVLAELDTSGAGDTTATLVVADQSGAEIAAVPQGQAVTGGGQGRATWALRLAEESGSAAAAVLYAYGHFHSATSPPDGDLPIITEAFVGVTPILGGKWVIGKSGLYVVSIDAYVGLGSGDPAGTEAALRLYNFTHPPEIVDISVVTPIAIPPGQELDIRAASVRLAPLAAGDTLGVQLSGTGFGTNSLTYDGRVGLYRIA